jgi:DNA replication protein DnaC
MTTATMNRDELARLLQVVGLRGVAAELDDLMARARKGRWSPAQLVEQTARIEQRDRERRSLERRMSSSRVGRFKPMTDFDWNWPKKIDREAVRQGHSALFVEAARMLLDLSGQESSRALERRLKHYARPQLLCIDEVGYLSYDARAADLLYEVISRRYETKATVVTTNLAFADWPTAFPNASCVAALIDRLTHRADVVVIEGDSYRRREAEARRKTRSKARTKR